MTENAHRTHPPRRSILVRWDDCVEIWNEGELPAGYTPDTLLQKHSSRPRNKNIANAFFKAGFIESWGRGYEKICEGFRAAGLPMPTIEEADGGVRIIFQRNNPIHNQGWQDTDKKSNKKSGKKSSKENEGLLVSFLSQTPNATLSDMHNATGLSVSGIRRIIQRLREQGILRRVGPDKGGHWEILREV